MATLTYATVADYEAARGLSGADAARIGTLLTTASRTVDRICGRRFYLDDTTSTRTYEPEDDDCLAVDDFATTTGLVIVDYTTTLPTTDYMLEPANNIGPTGEPWPFTRIELLYRTWTTGFGRSAAITARWGWPSVPPAVKEATILAAADLHAAKDNRFGAVGFDGGVLRIRENPQVMAMLNDYVRADVKYGVA